MTLLNYYRLAIVTGIIWAIQAMGNPDIDDALAWMFVGSSALLLLISFVASDKAYNNPNSKW